MSDKSSLSNFQKEPTNWLEKQEYPQARDILIHFNKKIYPEIEQKYHPTKWIIQENIGHKLLQLFSFTKKENININQTERSYKELWIQTAQWITNFILWEHPDPSRIQILLEAIRLDMITVAYGNIHLDYSYAADRYEKNGDETKKQIIKECLKICADKFWWRVSTLTITDNLLIWNSKEWWTTIQNKDDFLQNNK